MKPRASDPVFAPQRVLAHDERPVRANHGARPLPARRLYFSQTLNDTTSRREGSSGVGAFVPSHADDEGIAGSSGARSC